MRKEKQRIRLQAALRLQCLFRRRYLRKIRAKNVLERFRQLLMQKKAEKKAGKVISIFVKRKLKRIRETKRHSFAISAFQRRSLVSLAQSKLAKKVLRLLTVAVLISIWLCHWLVSIRRCIHLSKVAALEKLLPALYLQRQSKHGIAAKVQGLFRGHLTRGMAREYKQARLDAEQKRQSEEDYFIEVEMKEQRQNWLSRIKHSASWRIKMERAFLAQHTAPSKRVVPTSAGGKFTFGQRMKLKLLLLLSFHWRRKFIRESLKRELEEEERILRFKYREIHGFDKWAHRYRVV